jgi:predicted GTPase
MSRWRIGVVVALLGLPFVGLAVIGSYYLWTLHWGFYAWWPMAACMALGYVLAWYWQYKRRLLRPPDFETPIHWTPRDGQAWKLVEARAQAAGSLSADRLSDPSHYQATALEMAQELARFYHPAAQDPVSSLTIPEILAVIELAARDLRELVNRYLPGGHLLTVRDWRRARQATEWYQSLSTLYWAVAAVFSPLETGARFAASQLGLSAPWQMLQQNLLVWFYTAYIHRLGTYLIDLNSGRLRVGPDRYRELVEQYTAPAGADGAPEVAAVTVTLLGQVKTGKSSLVNALLGEQRARTDVLPATQGAERYQLHTPEIPTRLALVDTVGYGHAGPKADQLAATREAARQSDVLLLVLHARSPARQADVALLDELRGWFAAHPDLKQPPLVAVLTHIDLLSPSLEWAPPYDWRQGSRPKEHNIRDAVAAAQQQLGDRVAAVVPVCTAGGKTWGIEEELLPAVLARLDEAHGVALLRCLKAEKDTGRVRKIFHQLLAVAREAARVAWEQLVKPPGAEGRSAGGRRPPGT